MDDHHQTGRADRDQPGVLPLRKPYPRALARRPPDPKVPVCTTLVHALVFGEIQDTVQEGGANVVLVQKEITGGGDGEDELD